MSELLSCPFCGGEASIGRRDYFFEDSNEYAMSAHYVECSTCYVRTIEYKSKDGAADAWNRRAERTCRMVDCGSHDTCVVNRELSNGNIMSMEFGYKQCSECGANAFDCPTVRYCPNCGSRVVTADGDR